MPTSSPAPSKDAHMSRGKPRKVAASPRAMKPLPRIKPAPALPPALPRRFSPLSFSSLRRCSLSGFSSSPSSSSSSSSPFPSPSSSCSSFEKLPRPCPGFYSFPRMEHFWTRGSVDRNKALVEQLKQYGVIRSKKVAEVMETIDRGLFVPDGSSAYIDSPMPIGYNATISAPHMHATCLELLEEHLQPGMHALDVGSGTGYLTACFAMMVGPQGCAVGVEHIPELVVSSIENVKRSAASSLLNEGSLSLHVADGRQGWPEHAPYDAIHVGAAAAEIPQALLDQLKPGGRMVIPVGNFFQDLQVVDKRMDGSISIRSETSVRYVPLTSRAAQLQDF